MRPPGLSKSLSRLLTVVNMAFLRKRSEPECHRKTHSVFCYGLELNISLLHTIVGGPKPSTRGPFQLSGFQMAWTVHGHLPNAVPSPDGVIEGLIATLTTDQLQRLEAARLVPALYRWRQVTVAGPRGRSRALMLHVPDSREPGLPNQWIWQTVLDGAIAAGLSDRTVEEIANARVNDAGAALALRGRSRLARRPR